MVALGQGKPPARGRGTVPCADAQGGSFSQQQCHQDQLAPVTQKVKQPQAPAHPCPGCSPCHWRSWGPSGSHPALCQGHVPFPGVLSLVSQPCEPPTVTSPRGHTLHVPCAFPWYHSLVRLQLSPLPGGTLLTKGCLPSAPARTQILVPQRGKC